MPERELAADSQGPRKGVAGASMSSDEIELPAALAGMPEGQAARTELPKVDGSRRRLNGSGGLGWLVGSALILGALIGGGLYWLPGGSETGHANWQHVAAAAQASTPNHNNLTCVDLANQASSVTAIELTASDQDLEATQQLRAALANNDADAAVAALTPSGPSKSDVAISPSALQQPELIASIREQRTELYRIELFDSCDEDGDAVEIVVNNSVFATVNLQHKGTPIVIPLSTGTNSIVVRATQDGGGGVTVMFRTSKGDFFARDMTPGEDHRIEVVVP